MAMISSQPQTYESLEQACLLWSMHCLPYGSPTIVERRHKDALNFAGLRLILSNFSWQYRSTLQLQYSNQHCRVHIPKAKLRLALKAGRPTAYAVPRLLNRRTQQLMDSIKHDRILSVLHQSRTVRWSNLEPRRQAVQPACAVVSAAVIQSSSVDDQR
jgi:hypothetical protein